MKTTKLNLTVLSLALGALLLAPRLTAQETNDLSTNATNAEPAALAETVSNEMTAAETDDAATNDSGDNETWNHAKPIVLFGQDAELKTNETAEAVVVIGGSAKVHGRVHEAIVVIGGDMEVDGEVGDSIVAIFGNIHLKPGAKIRTDAVTMMGTISADAGTKIGGDTVAIGGKLDLADGAVVKGERVNIGLPGPLGNIEWVRDWFRYCFLEARPLAPQVGFVWVIAGVFFLVYLFIATLFPRPVQFCVDDLDRRPATIFLMGLLTKLLMPFVYLILVATGVGLIVTPFLWIALLLCSVVGKVALIQWLGAKARRSFGSGFQKPVVAFILGSVIITVLYIIPVVGFLTYLLLGVWGLGSGVTAIFARLRRETPDKPVPPATPFAPAPASTIVPPVTDASTPPPLGTEATFESSFAARTVPPIAPSIPPLTAPVAPSFPKANLWERLCAAFLDIILIGIVVGIANAWAFCLIVALAYFAGMWTWRGTTVGSIVLKLKVVRTDGRPLTFVVALVRGLAAAFSTVIFFLGFLWIAWDKDKQGWHDKIAGTEVIRLPHSTPLVML